MIEPMGSPWTAPRIFTSRARRVSTNFPTTSGAFQPSLEGASNAFVTKLNSGGASLVYSTYLGGSGIDQGTAIAVTSAGACLRYGLHAIQRLPHPHSDASHPGTQQQQPCAGRLPAPMLSLPSSMPPEIALTYSTYLGGNGPDFGQAIALDSTGDPYITGSTSSTNFPAIHGQWQSIAYKSTLTGTAGNAFIAKIDSRQCPQYLHRAEQLELRQRNDQRHQRLAADHHRQPQYLAPDDYGHSSRIKWVLSTTVFTETDC